MRKFRVKVTHFINECYEVRYSNFYGLIWHGLYRPYYNLEHKLEWLPVIENYYEDAVKSARSIKSISDIRNFQRTQDEEANKILDKAKHYWNTRPPSKTNIL